MATERFRANDRDDSGVSSYGHEPNRAVVESGHTVARALERAVTNQNGEEYQSAMHEVNAFRDSHSGKEGARQYSEYLNAVTSKLERDGKLHSVELFAANQNFGDMDSAGVGRVDRAKAESYKGQNYLDTHFSRSGERLADPDGKGATKEKVASALHSEVEQRDADWLFAARRDGTRPFYDRLKDKTPEQIHQALQNDTTLSPQSRRAGQWAEDHLKASGGTLSQLEESHKNLNHIFEKGAGGKSLYDRMEKDKDGNITNANILRDKHLSDEDRKALKWLGEQRSFAGYLSPFTDYMKADRLHDLAQKAGVVEPSHGSDNTPRGHLSTLFERNNEDGKSLYNRLKDEHGHIPHGAIEKMLENPGLTARQRASLEYMKSKISSPFWGVPDKDFDFVAVREMAEKEGLVAH